MTFRTLLVAFVLVSACGESSGDDFVPSARTDAGLATTDASPADVLEAPDPIPFDVAIPDTDARVVGRLVATERGDWAVEIDSWPNAYPVYVRTSLVPFPSLPCDELEEDLRIENPFRPEAVTLARAEGAWDLDLPYLPGSRALIDLVADTTLVRDARWPEVTRRVKLDVLFDDDALVDLAPVLDPTAGLESAEDSLARWGSASATVSAAFRCDVASGSATLEGSVGHDDAPDARLVWVHR